MRCTVIYFFSQWFLRPVKNAPLLRQRYDAVTYFITPRNKEVVEGLTDCLKKIKSLPVSIIFHIVKNQNLVTWGCSNVITCSSKNVWKCKRG